MKLTYFNFPFAKRPPSAQARGVVFGRRPGQRIKADKLEPKILRLVAAGQSYRQIGRQLDISKNTVLEIVKRNRANDAADERREIIV